jgi:plasmid stabilization system protein ParE
MIKMDKITVLLSPSAQSDFLCVMEHIDSLTPDAAELYFSQFIEKMEELRKSPASCPYVRDSQLRLRGYRTLSIKGYLVFFIISGNAVEVRRILHADRQYDRLT